MAEYRNLKKDEILFQQGDIPDNMYIVRSGHFSIFIKENNVTVEISRVSAGQLIGEMGLFDKKNRSAGVKALDEASVVILPYAQLEKQLDTLPEWVKITMRTLSEKLRETNKKFFS